MENEKKLLLLGGGGHCHSVLDSVKAGNWFDEIGIVDKKYRSINGADVVGQDEELGDLYEKGWSYAFITVGSVGNTELRHKLYDKVRSLGFIVPIIVDPSAVIASDVNIGEGVYIGKNVIVNAGSSIAEGCIINSGAIVEHDCLIGEFSHVSPGAVLCGQVLIGKDTHIGAGSVVIQGISIGDRTMIGAGSVVVNNVTNDVKAFGNPCKEVK